MTVTVNTNKEREQLKKAYTGAEWRRKVDRMDDAQVVAIYRRLQNQGRI